MIKPYFYFTCILTASLFLSLSTSSFAQQKNLTSETATASKGFTVINPGESILLYKYQHQGHSAKDVDRYAPKYYFTTASSNVLKELTKGNLKKAFPANHLFHDAIDANFNKDEELINYDDFHKMFKLNRLLQNNISMSKQSPGDSMSGDSLQMGHRMERSNRDTMNWDHSMKEFMRGDTMKRDHNMNTSMVQDTIKMDNTMMASMSNTMDKMHAMKLSGDFDHDFAHMMVMHHQAAIDMSEVEIANGQDAQVKTLAKKIITEQKTEIDQLQAFIKNYKVPEVKIKDSEIQPERNMGMKTMMDKMNHMKTTGNSDQDFITMMIAHHECAVTMAENELTNGKQLELKKIAQTIITTRKMEIVDFKALLTNLN